MPNNVRVSSLLKRLHPPRRHAHSSVPPPLPRGDERRRHPLLGGVGVGSASFVSAILLLSLAPLCSSADWPQWRGLARDGISQEKDWSSQWPKEGPTKLWDF